MTEKRGWSPSTAVVIAVGSELLTPHKTDTNSLFITDRLNAVGINVVQKLVVGDEPAGLASALRYAIGTARPRDRHGRARTDGGRRDA